MTSLMEDSEKIISGPELSVAGNWGSLAEFLIPKMKSLPKDSIVQVDCGTNESITSREFLQQSLEIAEGLIKFGLELEDVVILLSPNNIPSFVIATGILLSGGVLASIDEASRAFELQHYFREFKPRFIICETEKGKEVQTCVKAVNLNSKIILIDSTESSEEFFSWEDIKTQVDIDNYIPRKVPDPKKNVCVINCSSGTMGMPKGVALSHYSIFISFALSEEAIPEVHENFLLTSPLFWISGIMLLLKSCCFGQTRYIPKSTTPKDLLEALHTSKAHYLLLAPTTLLLLVRDENFEKYDLSSVKVVFSAGGPIGPTITAIAKKIWKGLKISNIYGLTEASGGVTISSESPDPDCMGQLFPGIRAKVVDPDTGKPLGPNKTGEFRLKSEKVMLGYYNNKEATNAAFDENGWLRTGDLVYYDEDSVFYYVGRMKEVIQYLNHKIPPAEVEAYLIGLPGVKDVAVVPVPHEIELNHLRALVVKDPKSDISAEYIIQMVKENLTERKHLRGGVQFVDALPRTKVGKLRRKEAQKMIQFPKQNGL